MPSFRVMALLAILTRADAIQADRVKSFEARNATILHGMATLTFAISPREAHLNFIKCTHVGSSGQNESYYSIDYTRAKVTRNYNIGNRTSHSLVRYMDYILLSLIINDTIRSDNGMHFCKLDGKGSERSIYASLYLTEDTKMNKTTNGPMTQVPSHNRTECTTPTPPSTKTNAKDGVNRPTDSNKYIVIGVLIILIAVTSPTVGYIIYRKRKNKRKNNSGGDQHMADVQPATAKDGLLDDDL